MAVKKSRFAKGIRNRQKIQIQSSKGGGSIFSDTDFNRWKPGKGKHIIDVVPYFAGKNDTAEAREEGTYMFSYGVHYNVGIDKKAYICPRTIPGLENAKCPICEHANALKNKGAEYDEYKQYFPKKRELYNVIVQDTEKSKALGVQVFDVSYFYMGKDLEPLMQLPVRPGESETEAYVDFALETEDGKSIAFTIGEKSVPNLKTGKTDTFPTYTGHMFLDRKYDIEDYLDDAYKLDELLNISSFDDIYQAFWDASPEDNEKEDEIGSTLRERKNKNQKEEEREDGVEELETEPEQETPKKTKRTRKGKATKSKDGVFNGFDFNDPSNIDFDSLLEKFDDFSRKDLVGIIKLNSIPLDAELGDDMDDYDLEDLRFLVQDWLEVNCES